MQHVNLRATKYLAAILITIGFTIPNVFSASANASAKSSSLLNDQPLEKSNANPVILAYLDENPTPLEQSEFDDLVNFAKSQVGGLVMTTSDPLTFEEWSFRYDSGANFFAAVSTDDQWLNNLKDGLLMTKSYWLEYLGETENKATIYLHQDVMDYMMGNSDYEMLDGIIPSFYQMFGELFQKVASFFNCLVNNCLPALQECLPPGVTIDFGFHTTPPDFSIVIHLPADQIMTVGKCGRDFEICQAACFITSVVK